MSGKMSLSTFGIKIVIRNLDFGKYWVNLVQCIVFIQKVK